ncbi:MAG: metallophosphoesterase [Chloroflexota bacterium]|nr:metallophosphoesterase [Chloroflexota bacterium]
MTAIPPKGNQLRILHTSDVHVGEGDSGRPEYLESHSPQSLKAVVNLAIKVNADMVIFAGDLFEWNSVSPHIVRFTKEQICRLQVPAIILPGNHDCLDSNSIYHKIDFFEDAPHVHIFRQQDGETFSFPHLDVAVWGRPIYSYEIDFQPLSSIPARGQEKWHIAVAHGFYVKPEPDTFFNVRMSWQISQDDIITSERDYIALGHAEGFACVCNDPVKAYYSGSPSTTGAALIVDFVDGIGAQVLSCPLYG